MWRYIKRARCILQIRKKYLQEIMYNIRSFLKRFQNEQKYEMLRKHAATIRLISQ